MNMIHKPAVFNKRLTILRLSGLHCILYLLATDIKLSTELYFIIDILNFTFVVKYNFKKLTL